MFITLLISIIVLSAAGFAGFFFYRKSRSWRKQIERSLKMVPFIVRIPQSTGQDRAGNRDEREIAKELISKAENVYYSIYSTYKKGFKNFIVGQKHLAIEIVAQKGEISFYFSVPITLVGLIEKTITSQYSEAVVEEAEEHNIFFKEQNLRDIYGGEFSLRRKSIFPLKTYETIDLDPLEAITNSLSKLEEKEGAAIQILIRPADPKFVKSAKYVADRMQKGEYKEKFMFSKVAREIGKGLSNAALNKQEDFSNKQAKQLTPAEEETIKAIQNKASKPVFETVIRVIVSASSPVRGEMIQNEIIGSFQQFNDFNLNQLKFERAKDKERLVTDYIFRFFGFRSQMILNAEELASIYHLPNYLIRTPNIKWLPAKRTAAPVALPSEGTILGETAFRGETRDIRLSNEDQKRHIYIIGQTGTGKTNMMKNMILDEISKGNGLCYIDPHGMDFQDILYKIPKERAEDVVIFDASDVERPLGLNLFEAKTIEEQDFVIQEAIQMLYKLYDPGHTGIMGPRFEHWFRNAALAIMADPKGGTFLEVPKIFTDDNYLQEKLKYVKDPVVRNFWLSEMAQTNEFHKSEVLGWFVGKFGAFMTNSTMRNILGQVETSLNLQEIMDKKKILLINLAKGKVGELNMSLLGMILVSKIQMTAMSRVGMPEDQIVDFTLYVDEFQNFATDSFASILSEARKFGLRLVVANQFIGQLKEEIKDAVFGNVGTLVSFRVGPEDGEFMAKQFEPVFNTSDLINIENYHAFIKLMVSGMPTKPFTMKAKPPTGTADKGRGEAIRQLARLKYGRAREIVDKEIQEKLQIGGKTEAPMDVPRDIMGG
ncbi:MAG: type IV secretion system DNA-binding domain-containing protein [Patescibacteria group bacterium]|nr:type IV secretion system DNA-binding domain-containing protein [Patescibacteria group bacterium]